MGLKLGTDLAGVLAFAPLPDTDTIGHGVASPVSIVLSGAYDDQMRTRGSWANGAAEARIVEHLHGLGYRTSRELFPHPEVTAIVAANDDMAFGIMRALHENNVSVPRHVSVFGWDETEQATNNVPSLSTVHMNVEAQGATGMAQLISRIRGGGLDGKFLSAPKMELIFRQSVGPVRAEATV